MPCELLDKVDGGLQHREEPAELLPAQRGERRLTVLPPLYFRATCRFANDGLETMVRASKNREDAKVRQAKKEQAWKELHEDD